MPVIFSYDIEGATSQEHNRLASMFERLGWQSLGGSTFRYPALGSRQPTEDWFNHVVPALGLFRSFVRESGRTLSRCSLDADSSTGLNPDAPDGVFGAAPASGATIKLYKPSQESFGKEKLQQALDDGLKWPY